MYTENLPIVFINCDLFPFVSWIAAHKKVFETRNKNTLKSLICKRVYIAETGKGKRPVIRCVATIDEPLKIESKTEYNKLRKQTKIKKGSVYDWKTETKRKYLYPLINVIKIPPFIPLEGKRHGFAWMEYNGKA